MKCLYYLTGTLDSTHNITKDLQDAGVENWFIHVLCKNEAGLKKKKIHSSNYLEQLDILRYGLLGAASGFVAGLIAALVVESVEPFGPDAPNIINYFIVGVLTLFGAWEGGLIGIAAENKKIALFREELDAGKYLILIYAKDQPENRVKQIMETKHPEARMVAEDASFYNPFTSLKRL